MGLPPACRIPHSITLPQRSPPPPPSQFEVATGGHSRRTSSSSITILPPDGLDPALAALRLAEATEKLRAEEATTAELRGKLEELGVLLQQQQAAAAAGDGRTANGMAPEPLNAAAAATGGRAPSSSPGGSETSSSSGGQREREELMEGLRQMELQYGEAKAEAEDLRLELALMQVRGV